MSNDVKTIATRVMHRVYGPGWSSYASTQRSQKEFLAYVEDEIYGALAESERRLKACVEALESVEWVWCCEHAGDHSQNECPWCGGEPINGHRPTCQRQAALRLARGESGEKSASELGVVIESPPTP